MTKHYRMTVETLNFKYPNFDLVPLIQLLKTVVISNFLLLCVITTLISLRL